MLLSTSESLMVRLAHLASEIMPRILRMLRNETIRKIPQDETKATTYPKRSEVHALINWDKPASEIYNLIRGMNPYPLAYSFYRREKVRFLRSEIVKNDNEKISAISGQIVKITGGGCLLVLEIENISWPVQSNQRLLEKSLLSYNGLSSEVRGKSI